MNIERASHIIRLDQRTTIQLCRDGKLKAKKKGGVWDVKIPIFIYPLTPEEVADGIGTSVRYVQDLCQEGIIEAVKIGHCWRIDHYSGTKFILSKFRYEESKNEQSRISEISNGE